MEAAPFLLLGSLLSAVLEVYVSSDAMTRFLPRTAVGQVLAGVFAGMLLPTCECGIVPVVRRLLHKGVPPRTAIPFMMCAPVINPVVIASTLFAFQGNVDAVVLRCLLVLVPAVAIGMALGAAPASTVLREPMRKREEEASARRAGQTFPPDVASPDVRFAEISSATERTGGHGAVRPCGCGRDHAHHSGGHAAGGGCGCGCHRDGRGLTALLGHTAAEFIGMARFLVLGAVVASAFKTFLPPSALEMFTSAPWLAIAGLMLLAILLSVCSEADAFVAGSFTAFPFMAKIAFIAVGPLVDLKLIPMFFAVFRKRVAFTLIIVPIVSIYAMAAVLAALGV